MEAVKQAKLTEAQFVAGIIGDWLSYYTKMVYSELDLQNLEPRQFLNIQPAIFSEFIHC